MYAVRCSTRPSDGGPLPDAAIARDRPPAPPCRVLLLGCVVLLVASQGTYAETLTVTGADGADGADSQAGLPGQPGEPGEDATAAVVSNDSASSATANGGTGGNGGAGGAFLSGLGRGDGGAGGAATASVDTGPTVNSGNSLATANGGDGGAAGSSGGPPAGAGAAGGHADARATDHRVATRGIAIAVANGGDGGDGYGPSGIAGQGGTVEVEAVAITDATIDPEIRADTTATGGDGGDFVTGSAGQAGHGGDVVLIDTVSGQFTNVAGPGTPVIIDFAQTANGGDGGNATLASGDAGNGGSASSTLSLSSPLDGLLKLEAFANGGNAGEFFAPTSLPTAGTGMASVTASGQDALEIRARSVGGVGGARAPFGTGASAMGADATALGDVTHSGSTGDAFVDILGWGGEGGESRRPEETGARGGDGYGTATFTDSGFDGTRFLLATGRGGRGGRATTVGFGGSTGGHGGDGFGTFTYLTAATPAVIDNGASAQGAGGDGGRGLLAGGDGGEGHADVSGTDVGGGHMTIWASATGGDGGEGLDPTAMGGDGGAGTVVGFGESLVGGDVTVQGKVTGGAGAEGGAPGLSGQGGDVLLVDTVSGTTTGRLELVQIAVGGDQETGDPAAPQLRDGDASSTLRFVDGDSGALDLISDADGRLAHAEADATGQEATTAHAIALAVEAATSIAFATGASGDALAEARSYDRLASSMEAQIGATAFAELSSSSAAQARTSLDGTLPAITTPGAMAASVTATIPATAGLDAMALVDLQDIEARGPAEPLMLAGEVIVDGLITATAGLLVSFDGTSISGPGFESLRFYVEDHQGDVLYTTTFVSAAVAELTLKGSTPLEDLVGGSIHAETLSFGFELSSDEVGTETSLTLGFGTIPVPEPRSSLLAGSALLAGLSRWRARRPSRRSGGRRAGSHLRHNHDARAGLGDAHS